MILSDFKALTFDCYGTLIDWESGIWDALQPVIASNKHNDITRTSALVAFAKIETAQQLSTPEMLYCELLATVHKQLASHFNLKTDSALDNAFGQSVPQWPAFADTADALRLLKKRFKLVILSNVDRAGFAASNKKLGVEFDAIYTAQDIGSYKPDIRNFEFMLKHLKEDHGVMANEILHTAQSLHHDMVMADKIGINKAWIDRQNLKNSDHWGATAEVAQRPTMQFYFESLLQMAELR